MAMSNMGERGCTSHRMFTENCVSRGRYVPANGEKKRVTKSKKSGTK
jgi:hypothetical protein